MTIPASIRLADVARDQWGLITRRQAEQLGIAPSTFARAIAPGGMLERVANGVYLLRGAPTPDHLALRADWLRIAPESTAWERKPSEGVVSHRSAAALYGLGDLPADVHEFTTADRRQSGRSSVRLHRGRVADGEWAIFNGLPVTRPSRTSADLLSDSEDPEAVASIVADALRGGYDEPEAYARSLAPRAGLFGIRRGDGFALLAWLLDLVQDPQTERWLTRAGHQPERRYASAVRR
jgi:hypothetical protein